VLCKNDVEIITIQLLTFSACLDAEDLLQHKDFLLTKFELNNENFSSGVRKFWNIHLALWLFNASYYMMGISDVRCPRVNASILIFDMKCNAT